MNHSIQQDLWKCWSMCTGLHCKLDLTKCCKHKKWFLVQNLQDYTAVVDDGAHPTFLQQVEGRSLSERAPRTPVMPTTEGNVGAHMLSTCRQASWRTHSRSFRVYRDCEVWCFTVRHHPVYSKATHCYGYRATCYWNTKRNKLCKHENRIFAFTEIVRFGVSLCDITLYTQKQNIVMVTELHVTETPNLTISVNTKIGFSRLQRLWGLVLHCATSPCALKSNTLLWLQSYILLKHQTEKSL
jgi:hypothetical protein